MLTKNQIITIVCIVIAIIVALIFFFKESFTYFSYPLLDGKETKENEGKYEIREDFPQTSPMNVLYSDSLGNLSSTDDLGLKNLTITENGALLLGNKFRFNANRDAYLDDDYLRLMNKDNNGYGGGFAGSKIYGKNSVQSDGTMSAAGALSAGSISTSGALSARSISTTGAVNAGSISTTGAVNAGSVSTNGLEISKTISDNNNYGLLIKYTNTEPAYYDWSIGPYVKNGAATFVIRGGADGHDNLRNLVEIDAEGSITAKGRNILNELDAVKSRLDTAEAKLANFSSNGKVIKVDELHVKGTTDGKYWKLKKTDYGNNHIKFYPESGSAGPGLCGDGSNCGPNDGYLFAPGGGWYSGAGINSPKGTNYAVSP